MSKSMLFGILRKKEQSIAFYSKLCSSIFHFNLRVDIKHSLDKKSVSKKKMPLGIKKTNIPSLKFNISTYGKITNNIFKIITNVIIIRLRRNFTTKKEKHVRVRQKMTTIYPISWLSSNLMPFPTPVANIKDRTQIML
ncbi:hypothetical protein [Listeria grandensis]|uniref:hypothetical protein n=1 Tax=Listeria grandensis TaxID=1494963 RepID=UPI0016256E0D|nr:hypothetical protein [Listeria grandensis]